MKYFISALVLIATISMSQLAVASGCSLTKTLYDNGKYQRAYNTAKTYANYGDACAQYYLGLMYFNGQGTDRNIKLAHKYINKAAKGKYPDAIAFYDKQE